MRKGPAVEGEPEQEEEEVEVLEVVVVEVVEAGPVEVWWEPRPRPEPRGAAPTRPPGPGAE